MTGGGSTRRDFLRRAALAACTPLSFRPALAQGSAGRVVVIGGGFAGATLGVTHRRRKVDSNPWSRYMADAFETILVAWLAFAFLPERPTRSQGGTDGSYPLSSSGESGANLAFGDESHR